MKRFYARFKFLYQYLQSKGLTATLLKTHRLIQGYGINSLINSVDVAIRDTSSSATDLKHESSSYFNELHQGLKRSIYFCDFENKITHSFEKKIISFYLPQFHPFEENNKFWGEGFTEWSNVTKAFPLFKGHEQPRLPKDLGFYDLRLIETIKHQVRIAKNYGVHGFCFHYYWFSGHRVMETPLKNFVNDKTIDFNFCLCWANENWTRRWDGNDKDVLLEQKDHPEDYANFIKDISEYICDSRYIRINGKPLIIVYRAELLKDPKLATQIWREEAMKLGLPGLHLILSESFGPQEPSSLGFDAAVDFAPNSFPLKEISKDQTFFTQAFQGRVYDYNSIIPQSITKQKPYPFYHSLCMAWDNTARKGLHGTILHNCTPKSFGTWLSSILKNNPLNNVVFINAWNEWAEGTYLEPDRRNGFAYLQESYEVLNDADTERKSFIERVNDLFKPSTDKAILLHLHYFEAVQELLENSNPHKLDLIITVTSNINLKELETIKEFYPNTYFIPVKNLGRDVLPFLEVLHSGFLKNYKHCLKIHSKKSPHLPNQKGTEWRKSLYKDLLDLGKYEHLIKSNPLKGIWFSEDIAREVEDSSSVNFKRLKSLLKMNPKGKIYASGTMFWFDPKVAINALPSELKHLEFENEPLINDGSWAHVLERAIPIMIEKYAQK